MLIYLTNNCIIIKITFFKSLYISILHFDEIQKKLI